jgi:RNA-splicing ligase RtcB
MHNQLCLDTENNVWLMFHSGSRHIGNKLGNKLELAECHIATAKELAKLAWSIYAEVCQVSLGYHRK